MGRAQKEGILQAEAEMAIVLSALSHFSLSIAELSESARRRAVVLPRQIAMYLAKQMTAASLPRDRSDFGAKHHTTVGIRLGKLTSNAMWINNNWSKTS